MKKFWYFLVTVFIIGSIKVIYESHQDLILNSLIKWSGKKSEQEINNFLSAWNYGKNQQKKLNKFLNSKFQSHEVLNPHMVKAIILNDLRILENLLISSSNPNQIILENSHLKITPLICAVFCNGTLPMLDLLIKNKADLNFTTSDMSALTFAILTRNIPIINILINNGTSVRLADISTAMLLANEQIALILLNHFKIIPSEELYGAFLLALLKNYPHVIEKLYSEGIIPNFNALSITLSLRRIDILKFFLEQGINLNQINTTSGVSLLSQLAIAESVINAATDQKYIDSKDYKTLKSFIKPSTVSIDTIINLLIKYNVNLNIQEENGTTTLMEAAANGKDELVKALLKYGANPQLKNNKGQTALDIALENDNDQIAILLQPYSIKTK
jgi:ankyrin repeat protein